MVEVEYQMINTIQKPKRRSRKRKIPPWNKEICEQYWEDHWKNSSIAYLFNQPDPEVFKLLDRIKRRGIKKVLDAGCGLGRHTAVIAKMGFETFAFDRSEYAVNYTINKMQSLNYKSEVVKGNFEKIPFPDKSFDLVIAYCSSIYLPLEELKQAIAEMHRVLNDSGYLYITFMSTQHKEYARGPMLEKNTFFLSAGNCSLIPHHFSDKSEINRLLNKFDILASKEKELMFGTEIIPESFHHLVLARK